MPWCLQLLHAVVCAMPEFHPPQTWLTCQPGAGNPHLFASQPHAPLNSCDLRPDHLLTLYRAGAILHDSSSRMWGACRRAVSLRHRRAVTAPLGKSQLDALPRRGIRAQDLVPREIPLPMAFPGLDVVVGNLVAATAAARSDAVSDRQAAVLIPLFEDPSTGQVHVVLTRRSTGLATHSGEVCLPGGRRDPEDVDDAATAVREAEEELGIPPASVRVLGCLPALLSKHRLSVRPVLAAIPPDLPFVPNPGEVDSVFAAPLSMFVEPPAGCHWHKDHAWEEGLPFRMHFFKHAHRGSEYVIWGLTAGILVEAAQIAFARDAAFAVSVPHAPPYASLVFHGGRLSFDAGRTDGVLRAWQKESSLSRG